MEIKTGYVIGVMIAIGLAGCAQPPGEYFGEYDDYYDGKATTYKSYVEVEETAPFIQKVWRVDVCESPYCRGMTYDAYDKDGKSIHKMRVKYTIDCDELEFQQNRREWYGHNGKMLFWEEFPGTPAWEDFSRDNNPRLNYRELREMFISVCEKYAEL